MKTNPKKLPRVLIGRERRRPGDAAGSEQKPSDAFATATSSAKIKSQRTNRTEQQIPEDLDWHRHGSILNVIYGRHPCRAGFMAFPDRNDRRLWKNLRVGGRSCCRHFGFQQGSRGITSAFGTSQSSKTSERRQSITASPIARLASATRPPEINLRDYPSMMVDVERWRDSDFVLTAPAEIYRYASLLWLAAWHQIPAGSLPNDESLPKFWPNIAETLEASGGCCRRFYTALSNVLTAVCITPSSQKRRLRLGRVNKNNELEQAARNAPLKATQGSRPVT